MLLCFAFSLLLVAGCVYCCLFSVSNAYAGDSDTVDEIEYIDLSPSNEQFEQWVFLSSENTFNNDYSFNSVTVDEYDYYTIYQSNNEFIYDDTDDCFLVLYNQQENTHLWLTKSGTEGISPLGELYYSLISMKYASILNDYQDVTNQYVFDANNYVVSHLPQASADKNTETDNATSSESNTASNSSSSNNVVSTGSSSGSSTYTNDYSTKDGKVSQLNADTPNPYRNQLRISIDVGAEYADYPGSASSEGLIIKAKAGSTIELPTVEAHEGYYLVGWSQGGVEEDPTWDIFTYEVTLGEPTNGSKNATIYAIYADEEGNGYCTCGAYSEGIYADKMDEIKANAEQYEWDKGITKEQTFYVAYGIVAFGLIFAALLVVIIHYIRTGKIDGGAYDPKVEENRQQKKAAKKNKKESNTINNNDNNINELFDEATDAKEDTVEIVDNKDIEIIVDDDDNNSETNKN